MELSTGELSGLCGKLLLMTATASKKTICILKEQFPEVSKWKTILNLPVRDNVTILTPPSNVISFDYVKIVTPFIHRMIFENETYLILVRGTDRLMYFLKLILSIQLLRDQQRY